jgi:hypothetical protein
VLLTFLVFFVVMFGKKTKMGSNTQPTKHYNKENKKGEQHSTNQTLQHRKLKR